MRRAATATVLCAGLWTAAASTPALSQAPALPADLSAAMKALDEAWSAAPLSFAVATFTEGAAAAYGKYTPKENPTFAPDDAIHVYAEPVGYGYARVGEQYQIDLSADFALRNTGGQILAEGKDFARLTSSSRQPVREFPATLTFRFGGLVAGDYVLETRLSDANSEKAASFSLPFTVEAAQ